MEFITKNGEPVEIITKNIGVIEKGKIVHSEDRDYVVVNITINSGKAIIEVWPVVEDATIPDNPNNKY